MIDRINGAPIRGPLESHAGATGVTGASQVPGTPRFADMLKDSIEEVARLQNQSSQGVQDLMTGRTDNIAQVMTDAEKASLAFKTLLAIRSKLMQAYEEIKGMSI